jgi:hypothetical protein
MDYWKEFGVREIGWFWCPYCDKPYRYDAHHELCSCGHIGDRCYITDFPTHRTVHTELYAKLDEIKIPNLQRRGRIRNLCRKSGALNKYEQWELRALILAALEA